MDFRDLRRTLLSKLNASEDRQQHHVFFYFNVNGKEFRATKFSHSAKGQIDVSLLNLIAKQLRLRNAEIDSLVACPLSKEEYFRLWSQRGPGFFS